MRELWPEGRECGGVGETTWSPSSSVSSSSPMANVPPSSGTLQSDGLLALWGIRMLSNELLRDARVGLVAEVDPLASSFLRCFCRSSSSLPLSKVNDRNASKRFLDLKRARMKCGLPCLLISSGVTVDRSTLTAIMVLDDGIHGL